MHFQRAYPINADGEIPDAGLTDGRDGFLYGTTLGGGPNGGGVVYRLRPDGSGYQVLHAFPAPPPLPPLRYAPRPHKRLPVTGQVKSSE